MNTEPNTNNLDNVLAFDLASTIGYAQNVNGTISSGFQKFTRKTNRKKIKDEHRGIKFLDSLVWMRKKIQAAEPTLVCFEEPGEFLSGDANFVANGLKTLLFTLCAKYDIEMKGVYPSTLKLFATGYGHAKKPQVIKACQEKLNPNIVQNDEADARWLLEIALTELNGGVGVTNLMELKF